MNKRFRVGDAKTRDGSPVVVYTVDGVAPETIVGQVMNPMGLWNPYSWTSAGKFLDGREHRNDLMSNLEPIKAVIQSAEIVQGASWIYPMFDKGDETLKPLLGKLVRITFEEIIE